MDIDWGVWPVPFDDVGFAGVVLVYAAYLFGYYVRGSFGFGSNLPAVLLTAVVLGPHHAVLLASVVATFGQVQLLPQGLHGANWSRVVPVVLAMVIGNTLGVWLLTVLSADWLLVLLGILVAFMVTSDRLNLLSRLETVIDVRSPRLAAGIGTVSSAMGTVAGGGALYLLAPYLRLAARSPLEFRSTNVMIAGISSLNRILMLSAAGLVTLELLVESVALLPMIVLGTLAGTRFFKSAAPERFFAALQWMLLFAATLLAVKGAGTLLA
ncbi:MAG: sulfite exporter TauE/SafE family protein [Pseudomonadota bacterium]